MSVSTALTLIVLAVAATGCADRPPQRAASAAPVEAPTMFPPVANQPIPGVAVSLATAKASAPLGLPILPASTIRNPCSGASDVLRPLVAWMSPEGTIPEAVQFGVNYSDGVWMYMDSLEQYNQTAQVDGELAPVAEAFSPDDFPEGLVDGTVRGHAAWILDRPNFSCSSTAAAVVPANRMASPSPDLAASRGPLTSLDSTTPVIFDPSRTSNIKWAESGYVITVAGPYPAATLSTLIDLMSFDKS
jgi:hypothetical protein